MSHKRTGALVCSRRHTQLSRNLRAALCILASPPDVASFDAQGCALVDTPSVIVSVWAHSCRPDWIAPACGRCMPMTRTKRRRQLFSREEMKSTRQGPFLGELWYRVVQASFAEESYRSSRREKPREGNVSGDQQELYLIQHILPKVTYAPFS